MAREMDATEATLREILGIAGETSPSGTTMERIAAAVEKIEQYMNYDIDAEAYAAGTRGGVPVEEGDPAYHNNAAYYVSQAAHAVRYDTAQSLTDAEKAQARENIDALEPDGYYEGLTSGNAEQLVSSIAVTDKAPHLFRPAGGNNDIGNRETVKAVTGVSLPWNQLVPALEPIVLSKPDHRNPSYAFTSGTSVVSGHKYYYKAVFSDLSDIASDVVASIYTRANGTNVVIRSLRTLTNASKETVFSSGYSATSTGSSVGSEGNLWGYCTISNSDPDGATATISGIQLIDLTLMFGTEIADYVYSLEQANEGSGIAWLKSYGYFTQDYYPYAVNAMKHVTGLISHDMVGFNAWDEEWEVGGINSTTGLNENSSTQIRSKNYIPVIPNATYFFYIGGLTGNTAKTRWYDSEKKYLGTTPAMPYGGVFTVPSNAHYLRFCPQNAYGTTYKNDICIHLSHSGYRNGEYEPYVKHSYALDSTVTLMGVPKLDASNNLYYDGDIYPSSGEGTSRFVLVDMGTLTWHASSTPSCFYATVPYPYPRNIRNISLICAKYVYDGGVAQGGSYYGDNGTLRQYYSLSGASYEIYVHDNNYTDVADFKAALSGTYLVYEKQTPTSFSAAPYTNPQIVDDFGTEEFVVTPDSDGFQMPVGHETDYMHNLRDKLQRLPNLPDADGTYLVQYSNRQCSFIQYIAPTGLPTAPSGDGTYVLMATVADGAVTYSWVAE